MGRGFATGRYDSRQELVEMVWMLYKETWMNPTDIARMCKVSDGTVHRIIKEKTT